MKSEEAEVCLELKVNVLKMSFDLEDLLCSKGNASQMLCQNKNCQKTPFICSKKNCECQQTHKKCLKIMSEQFFTEINQKILPTQSIKQRVETIINDAIDYISKIRDQIEFNLKYLGLNNEEKQLIHLLSQKDLRSVTGSKVWKVAQSIYEQKQISSSYIIKEINKFWTANQKKFKKNFQKLKELSQKETQNLSLFLDSDIIKSPADIDTFLKFFNNDIVKTNLLYSAKKENFKIRKYQQACNRKKNTLLIVRSKEGKVFGGYHDKQFVKQQGLVSAGNAQFSQKSFVFSLTNKDKFLPNPKVKIQLNAFFQSPNFGYDFLSIYKEEQPRFKQNHGVNIQPVPFGGGMGFGGVPFGGYGNGFGGFGNPQQLGVPNLEGLHLGGNEADLTEHYCVIFESKYYQNQKYTSDEDSRLRFAGTKQKMFPITEWQIHQLEFDEKEE